MIRRLHLLACSVATLALLIACGGGSTSYQNVETAFVNVDVLTMRDEQVLRAQTVLVAEGRILAIAPSAEIQMPENTTKIDGEGKFLMPGLAEMHAHIPVPPEGAADSPIMEETLLLYLANGVTTIRGMLGSPHHLSLREAVAKGEILGPRIYTSGPSMNGRSVQSPEAARKMVMEQKQAGYDLLKLHAGLSLEVFNAIVSAANENDMKFAGHVSTDVGVRRALEAGYATIDHLDGYVEGLVPADAGVDPASNGWFGYNFTNLADPAQIASLAAATKEANVWVVPTQCLLERVGSPEDADKLAQEPEMRYMSPRIVQQWVSRKKRLQSSENYTPEMANRFIELRRQILSGLHEAGVGILLGSDAPQVFNVPGFSIHHELEALIKAGLTPLEALKTGTINPAIFLGTEGEFGTVSRGASADLLLLNANPLVDMANLKERAGVMVRGKWLPEATIQEHLQSIAAKYLTMK